MGTILFHVTKDIKMFFVGIALDMVLLVAIARLL